VQKEGLSRQLFGYSKSVVDARLKSLRKELENTQQRLQQVQAQLAKAEAEREELAITVAAMRRQHIQVAAGTGPGDPVTVVVGPTDSLGMITGLIDALEGSPHLSVQFRVFRDGFYRVDGQAHDRIKFIGWLRAQSAVRDVVVDEELVHVSPLGVSA
jgi:hypothetical protein